MRIAVRLSLLALLAAPLPATALANPIPADLQSSLKYRVHGTISASCTITQSAGTRVDVVALQNTQDNTVRSTETNLPFTVGCNTPVTLRMSSANGGLQTELGTSDSDFTSLVAYRAILNVPGQPAALSCDSQSMAPGGNGCQRALAAPLSSGDGQIVLETAASGELLLAGTYQDIVTLTVIPSMDGESAD